MNAEVYLTGSKYQEQPLLGTIYIQPEMTIPALGQQIDSCILTARGDNDDFANFFNSKVETSKAYLIAAKDNRHPMIRYSITLTAFDDSEVLGKAILNTAFWDRFDSLKEFSSRDIEAFPKIRINIAFAENPEGTDENPTLGTDFVVHPQQRCTDNYVRVGHIQHPDRDEFTISRRTEGKIPARHCILAKVSTDNAAGTADDLRLGTAWEMDGAKNTIGDPRPINCVSYETIHDWGQGLFGHFKGDVGEKGALADKSQLGTLVNGVAGKPKIRQLFRAPILPRMTLIKFDPDRFWNTDYTTLNETIDCHAVVRVVYHTEDRWTDHETARYPDTAQFSFAGDATVRDLENQLFRSFQNQAAAIRPTAQPVDKYRDSSGADKWYCQWFILPYNGEFQLMHKVHDLDVTVASFVDIGRSKINEDDNRVFLYTECHIMSHDVMHEEIGCGLG